jgi:hypothetical protein
LHCHFSLIFCVYKNSRLKKRTKISPLNFFFAGRKEGSPFLSPSLQLKIKLGEDAYLPCHPRGPGTHKYDILKGPSQEIFRFSFIYISAQYYKIKYISSNFIFILKFCDYFEICDQQSAS